VTVEAPAIRAEEPGPSDYHDPLIRRELARAAVWMGLAVAIALAVVLAQPLLLIIGGLVFAAILDGGTRLLGRVLPIARAWRLAIICLLALGFLVWTAYFAGSQLVAQAESLQIIIEVQVNRLIAWGHLNGLIPSGSRGNLQEITRQIMGSLGQVTAFVGNALGAMSSLVMIVVLGIFIATEPKLYERGLAWMFPLDSRADFYTTSDRMGFTLRRLMAGRLLGMLIEGVFVGVALAFAGVPMAALLGILTGLFAFLPNIGSIISGVLTILVGFSAGVETGLWAIGIYVAVQMVDGYLIVPTVARRSVDLAPALVLGAQLLFGALFGILGLALADPIVAMLKVMLERRAENAAEAHDAVPN
jgi:predicted PurR-regulated permease PerM